MVESGRHTAFFVSATAAVFVTVAASALWAQPPVARPQPPPKAPAPTTTAAPAPAKPATNTPATGTSTPPGGGQSGTGTSAATPTAKPTSPGGLTQNPPAAAAPAPAAPAAPPRSGEAGELPPTEAALGVPILPNAHFIGSYDAGGAGQRFYLFGTVQRFDAVVTYYRTVLRDKGELVFEIPATHMFEVGKFREDQVAFPPGVTVKDYTFAGSSGLANPRPGAAPVAFPTIIQIVPPAAAQPARAR